MIVVSHDIEEPAALVTTEGQAILVIRSGLLPPSVVELLDRLLASATVVGLVIEDAA